MFTDSPFLRMVRNGRPMNTGVWWVLMAPGLLLSLMAIAILVWPELLAYMIATVLLFAGISLTLWGWSMRKLSSQTSQRTIYYEMQ